MTTTAASGSETGTGVGPGGDGFDAGLPSLSALDVLREQARVEAYEQGYQNGYEDAIQQGVISNDSLATITITQSFLLAEAIGMDVGELMQRIVDRNKAAA